MSYSVKDVTRVAKVLKERQSKLDDPMRILKATELKDLMAAIKLQPPSTRSRFGQAVNNLKRELIKQAKSSANIDIHKPAIDVLAPFDVNTAPEEQPKLLGAEQGTLHPVMTELTKMKDIFIRMGFSEERSRLIDDDYHMFESLNFPKDHPARDDYDTFMTTENLILPAHTSTMQNRVLAEGKALLESDEPIAVVIPGRVFRNEDVDSTHEHTFHQVEGVYVGKGISLADMLGTIQVFLESYFKQPIEYKTQPFYFPFVEPGLEFLIKMPESLSGTDKAEWLEIMGCGMIHPKVLSEAGINSKNYSGFAWGMGVERLVMLKYGVDDIRQFMSGRLDFLKLFEAQT